MCYSAHLTGAAQAHRGREGLLIDHLCFRLLCSIELSCIFSFYSTPPIAPPIPVVSLLDLAFMPVLKTPIRACWNGGSQLIDGVPESVSVMRDLIARVSDLTEGAHFYAVGA